MYIYGIHIWRRPLHTGTKFSSVRIQLFLLLWLADVSEEAQSKKKKV
jgi:hypothetical protein